MLSCIEGMTKTYLCRLLWGIKEDDLTEEMLKTKMAQLGKETHVNTDVEVTRYLDGVTSWCISILKIRGSVTQEKIFLNKALSIWSNFSMLHVTHISIAIILH